MSAAVDVVIVGGGVIGLVTAYELARAGARVTIVERGELGRAASWAGAGIIAPGNPQRAATGPDRLRAESATRFPHLAAELHELVGLDIGYRHCGGFEYATADDPPDVDVWRREGIHFDSVGGTDQPDTPPTLLPRYYLADMAQVRNPWFLRALTSAVARLGVRVATNSVDWDWVCRGDRVEAVRTGQDSHAAGEFLVCAGAWTNHVLKPFDVSIPVRPVRGQMVLYRIDDPSLRHIHVWNKRYLVPRGDGLVLAGSTEEEAGFDNRTTESGIAELRSFAERAWPALGASRVEATWAGLRPGSADGLPYLGRVPGQCNLSVAAGHFRAGLQLSPATGRIMAELLLGKDPFIPLESFRLDRPAAQPTRPAFRS